LCTSTNSYSRIGNERKDFGKDLYFFVEKIEIVGLQKEGYCGDKFRSFFVVWNRRETYCEDVNSQIYLVLFIQISHVPKRMSKEKKKNQWYFIT